ncbi:hypothetical protein HZC00_02005 [Candidatus Kaiserbacteria bacterium]|nr:hypothetical protein [Candidatus Kaiserbacteria bacterium]
MKFMQSGILPLIGAMIVFGVSLWDSAMTLEAALGVLIFLSLYLFLFNKTG